MSSQEVHNKLTDEEKFKLIELYKENSELQVTQGIARSQKALKKQELVEEFNRKFSIKKKSIKKKENCRIKVGNSTKACFSWKTSQRPVKNSIYMGLQIKFASEKLQYFFLCVDEKCCSWRKDRRNKNLRQTITICF